MRRIDLEWFSMLTTWIPKSWTSINCINFPNINCFVSRSCFGIKSARKQWNTEYDAEKHNNTVEVSCGETIQQNGRAGVPSMSHALPSSTHFNFQFWFNINWDWTLPSSAHFNAQFWSIINWKWTLPSSVHLNIQFSSKIKWRWSIPSSANFNFQFSFNINQMKSTTRFDWKSRTWMKKQPQWPLSLTYKLAFSSFLTKKIRWTRV